MNRLLLLLAFLAVSLAIILSLSLTLPKKKRENEAAGLSNLSPSMSPVTTTTSPHTETTVEDPTQLPTALPSSEPVAPPTEAPQPLPTDTNPNPTTSATVTPTVSPSSVQVGTAAPMIPMVAPSPVSPTPIQDLEVDNVPVYYCPSTSTASATKSIVLWHGASFSRENWKNVGILEDFCSYPELSVLAMDMSVSSGHQQLKNMLVSLQSLGYITFPTTLVTPSASGYSVTNWLQDGDPLELVQYVNPWVPVACGSVASSTNAELMAISSEVLAIYGNEDVSGMKTSERLGELAGALVVELIGRHTVYLQSPVEFVDVIVEYLGLPP